MAENGRGGEKKIEKTRDVGEREREKKSHAFSDLTGDHTEEVEVFRKR